LDWRPWCSTKSLPRCGDCMPKLACLTVEQDAHVPLDTTSRSYVFRTGEIITE
jgi:hypothetical protein